MFGVNRRLVGVCLLGSILLGGSSGCETKAETGALIGGAAGAGLGAIIGNQSHGRGGAGALIGGAAGALGGAIVGNEMDKADRRAQGRSESVPVQPAYAAAPRVTVDEVIAWTHRGVRDSEIMDRIDRSGTVFHLYAADEMRMRDAGVSEEVIRAMRDTDR